MISQKLRNATHPDAKALMRFRNRRQEREAPALHLYTLIRSGHSDAHGNMGGFQMRHHCASLALR